MPPRFEVVWTATGFIVRAWNRGQHPREHPAGELVVRTGAMATDLDEVTAWLRWHFQADRVAQLEE